jgi:hypothetical protein
MITKPSPLKITNPLMILEKTTYFKGLLAYGSPNIKINTTAYALERKIGTTVRNRPSRILNTVREYRN